MIYLTVDTVTASLDNADWALGGDDKLSVRLANAWLSSKSLPDFEIVPDDVIMAGAIIAKAIADGEMYQGRTEGVVLKKSVKAGDVSSSKEYASGTAGEPMTASEQQALLLIAPYLTRLQGFYQLRVGRA